jgi:hypothetical protein
MSDPEDTILSNIVVVVAHPDDENLWFSSVLRQACKIIVVYEDFWAEPDIGAKRAAALAELPHPNIKSLKVPEAGTYGCANWAKPEISKYGIMFSSEVIKREIKRKAVRAIPGLSAHASPKSVSQIYTENYPTIVNLLRDELTSDMNVFTHNPWGEYGHEDHLQIFRAVDQLQSEIGFKQWMGNYVTNRSLPLAKTYFGADLQNPICFKTDVPYAKEFTDIYKKHDCWTWCDDWKWFEQECFTIAPKKQVIDQQQSHIGPMNVFSI